MQRRCQAREAGASPRSHDAGGGGPCSEWGATWAPHGVPRTPATRKQGPPCCLRSAWGLPAEPGSAGGGEQPPCHLAPALRCRGAGLRFPLGQGDVGGAPTQRGTETGSPLALLTHPARPARRAGEEGGSPLARRTRPVGTEGPACCRGAAAGRDTAHPATRSRQRSGFAAAATCQQGRQNQALLR